MDNAPARILLADEEEPFLTTTADLLRTEGYLCDCAQDVPTARTALEAHSYDLFITDITMPGNRDLAFIRDNHPIIHGIPVIVLTASPSVQTAVAALRLAVADYLIKPLDFSTLLHSVDGALEMRQVWQEAHNVHENTKAWTAIMERLEKPAVFFRDVKREGGFAWTLDNYLEQAVFHVAQITTNLKQTLHAVRHRRPEHPTDICTLLNCSKLTAYKEGLRDAITVIEKTKHAFKSKGLGELRKRLEALLQEPPVA